MILSGAVHDLSQTCYILYELCVNAIVNETVSVNTTREVVLVYVIEFPREFVWLVWGFSLAAVIISVLFIVAMLSEWCWYKGCGSGLVTEEDGDRKTRYLVAWWVVSLTTSLPVELAWQITTIIEQYF